MNIKMEKDNTLAKELRNLAPAINPPVANPTPLGLFAFGLTTALLQVEHTRLGGSTPDEMKSTSNLVWGYAMFYGGLVQMIAGLHEFRRNNTFAYTAFLSYGGWWMSLGFIEVVMMMTPSDAVREIGVSPQVVQAMLGMWGIQTFVFLICTLRLNKTLSLLFFMLLITFFLLAAGVTNPTVDTVGGWFGFVTAFVAFWLASVELINDIVGQGEQLIPVGKWESDPFKIFGESYLQQLNFAIIDFGYLKDVDTDSALIDWSSVICLVSSLS